METGGNNLKMQERKRMLKAPSKRTKTKGGRYSRHGDNVV